MLTVQIESNPSLKAIITPRDQIIFAKINQSNRLIRATMTPKDQILIAKIEPKTELEQYYETDNEAGGTTIIIGE